MDDFNGSSSGGIYRCGGDPPTLGIPAAPRPRFPSDPSGTSQESGYNDTFIHAEERMSVYYNGGGADASAGSCCSSSSPPPPPPPVRDASSLKYVSKYAPASASHEKHPSWPMAADASPLSPANASGSQRSKSWTDQTDYGKDPSTYVRPSLAYSKRGGANAAYRFISIFLRNVTFIFAIYRSFCALTISFRSFFILTN